MEIGLQDGSSRIFGPGEHFFSADLLPAGADLRPGACTATGAGSSATSRWSRCSCRALTPWQPSRTSTATRSTGWARPSSPAATRRARPIPPEPTLCEELGVSRTVVREAVKSLVAKGLLITGPKVGTRVLPSESWNWFDPDVVAWQTKAGLTREFLRDLQELRRIVEPAAVRLAAERATAAGHRRHRGRLRRHEGRHRARRRLRHHDLRFHQGLLRACHNRMVVQMSKALGALLRTSFEISTSRPDGPAQSLPLHRAVLDAVIAARRRSGRAGAILVLIDGARDDIEAVLSSRRKLPSLAPPAPRLKATAPPTSASSRTSTRMKLLITGGAGFVGARLARTLLAARHAGRPAHRPAGAGRPGPPRRPTWPPTHACAGARRRRCWPPARRCATRPSTASSTSPRRSRANARPTSTSACAPTSTARARCSTRCARASSAAPRRRGWCSAARWRCSAPTRRVPLPARGRPTTRCRHRRRATARRS